MQKEQESFFSPDHISETSQGTSNSIFDICVILVLVATRVPYLCPLAKVVPFSEIFMDPSDPKHVAKLLKGSDGPGVVNTTRTHRWGAFLTTQRKSLIRSGRTSITLVLLYSVTHRYLY